MTVPVFSLAPMHAQVDLLGAVKQVLASHRFVLGPTVGTFEAAFADYCGTGHCVGVASGTDALELALRAFGIGPKGRVVMVANAGPYGSTAVHAVGAMPVYVDVEPDSLTMDPRQLAAALHEGADAVIVTHLYGQLAAIEQIVEMAATARVPVIEDCAQAHGASRGGRRAGSFGAIGCFSFYPTKNLGAVGDGGAVVTDDDGLAEQLRQLRQYGWDRKYRTAIPGGRNSRLDELQAAVLTAKLPFLDAWNEERRAVARRYVEALGDLPLALPELRGEAFVAHLFVARVVRDNDRPGLQAHLDERGIGTDVHYPIPDHRQPAWARHRPVRDLPVTEAAAEAVLTLPCYPGLSLEDQASVIAAVRSYFESRMA